MGAYMWSEGAAPLVCPFFFLLLFFLLNKFRMIADAWGHSRLAGACFQRTAEPRCSFIIISRLEVGGTHSDADSSRAAHFNLALEWTELHVSPLAAF